MVGNQPATMSRHSSALSPSPGARPSASAGARYFCTVLRSMPNDTASSLFERPASQCMNSSIRSIDATLLRAKPRTPASGPAIGPEARLSDKAPAVRDVVPMGITWRTTAQGGEIRGENRPTGWELHGGRHSMVGLRARARSHPVGTPARPARTKLDGVPPTPCQIGRRSWSGRGTTAASRREWWARPESGPPGEQDAGGPRPPGGTGRKSRAGSYAPRGSPTSLGCMGSRHPECRRPQRTDCACRTAGPSPPSRA